MQLFAGINVVSVSVPDLDAAREFYSSVLGLGAPVYDLPDAGWIEFSTGAPSGNLSVTTTAPGWTPSTGTTVVLNTADCHAACAELRALGVRCDDPLFPATSPTAASTTRSATACRCAARRPSSSRICRAASHAITGVVSTPAICHVPAAVRRSW